MWKLAKLFIFTKIKLAQFIVESDSVNDGAVLDDIPVEEDFAKNLDGWSDEIKKIFFKSQSGQFPINVF